MGPWTSSDRLESDYSTAPTSIAARLRTIVSRCRGRLTLSAYPHLQIRPHQWANVSASSPPLRAGAVAPPLTPKMDIVNYSCPWTFRHVSEDHRIVQDRWAVVVRRLLDYYSRSGLFPTTHDHSTDAASQRRASAAVARYSRRRVNPMSHLAAVNHPASCLWGLDVRGPK